MNSYCEFVQSQNLDDVHRRYHDLYYGFPIGDDNELFGRLILEMNQAGLSWTTILNKERNFRNAYSDFSIDHVATYEQADKDRLLLDAGIIRNRLKIEAAIFNAKAIQHIQKEHGSWLSWLNKAHPLPLPDWVKLFKKHFKFVGGEIVKEFLMSTGFLPGAHIPQCPVYSKCIAANPPWVKSGEPIKDRFSAALTGK